MFFVSFASMLAFGAGRTRDKQGKERHRRSLPDLSALSDHELRDIGFRRDRPAVDCRHLIRM